jgi:hypothetical protein
MFEPEGGLSRGWRVLESVFLAAAKKGIGPRRIAEAAAKVLPKTIDKSGLVLARSLVARAPQLAENRAFHEAFKQRLERTWRKPFILYEVILVSATEAGSDFNEAYRPSAAKENDFVFEVLCGLHSRACLVAGEVYELLRGGYPHGAHARCRTLQELAVFAGVIAKGGQEVAERFLLHDAVENSAALDTYQAHYIKLGEEPFSQADIDAVHQRRDDVIQRFGKAFGTRYGWAATMFPKPPTFGDLQRLAELDHLRPYYERSTHLGVHASSRGARLNIYERGGQRMTLAGPTNYGLADPGQDALISLVQVTTTFLINGRSLGSDPTRLIACIALGKLTDDAGAAFLAAHHRLEAKEARFQARQAKAP